MPKYRSRDSVLHTMWKPFYAYYEETESKTKKCQGQNGKANKFVKSLEKRVGVYQNEKQVEMEF